MVEMCITKDLKTLLINAIDRQVSHETLRSFVVDMMPICPTGVFAAPAAAGEAEKKREMATRWPEAIYVNKAGKQEVWDSPSKLYKHLTGKEVSGSICDKKGKTCRPASLIDSFRFSGFIVQGNGEDSPESDPEKPGETLRLHKEWKQHLLDTNKKIVIIDPRSIKKIQQ